MSPLLSEIGFMRTVRVRRETGLMRLLTVMVSGGTPGGFPALAKI